MNGDCLKVSSEKKGLGVGEEEGSLVNQSYLRYPGPQYICIHTNKWEIKFFFFKWCLENTRLCLKRKRQYITSDKCHLHTLPTGFTLRVIVWNSIFEILLDHSQDSRAVYCVSALHALWVCCAPVNTNPLGQARKDRLRFFPGRRQSGPSSPTLRPLVPGGPTACLRRADGWSQGPPRWWKQLAGPHRNLSLHPTTLLVWKELQPANGAARKDPEEHFHFPRNWGSYLSDSKLPEWPS